MAPQLLRTAMLRSFESKATPTLFATNFFKTTDQDLLTTLECNIDIKRSGNEYAVDVIRNAGGNFNKAKQFNTKTFTPPYFDEYSSVNAHEMFSRSFGQTEYSESGLGSLVAKIVEMQLLIKDKIDRAVEKMCWDSILSGVITLVQNVSLDFKQKVTHNFAAATAWSTAAVDPVIDLIKAAKLIRQDANKSDSDFDCILSETSFKEFMALITAANSKYRLDVLALAEFQKSLSMGLNGATYHGKLVGGSYNFYIWTYPQYYTVPTGWGLANEGTQQPYITDERVIVMPRTPLDFRLVYAGIAQLQPDPRAAQWGLNTVPGIARGKYVPYFREDDNAQCIIAGLRSAPLPIPVEIDGFAVIQS